MARTIITIVGMADRMAGTSKKTGKDYDFVEVAIQYEDTRKKKAVACATIDGFTYDQFGIKTGEMYDAIVNQYNGKTYVDLIDQVTDQVF